MNAVVLPGTRFSGPGSFSWFAAHEFRLIWRDFASLVTAGRPARIVLAGGIILAFIAGMHWFSAYLLAPALERGIVADKSTLVLISGALAMMFSLMFSQAIESVTRAYYARSDLDLLLSSPAAVHRLFLVRTGALALQTVALSLAIASPLINVLAFQDHAGWLLAYLVLLALSALATSLAVLLTLFLFRIAGAAKTRLIAQILAAFVGAGFVVSLQGAAIIFGQGITRMSLFQSRSFVAGAPDLESWVWFAARASTGQATPAIFLLATGVAVLVGVIYWSTRRFAQDALAAAGSVDRKAVTKPFSGFARKNSPRSNLRRKEWNLLKRDPWLISQTLQQLLYLATPGTVVMDELWPG